METDLYNPCAPGSRLGGGGTVGDTLRTVWWKVYTFIRFANRLAWFGTNIGSGRRKIGAFANKMAEHKCGHHLIKEGYDTEHLINAVEKL